MMAMGDDMNEYSKTAGEVFVSHSSIMKMAVELGFAPVEEMQPVIDMTGEAVHRAWSRF